jgi:hypothetical protein
MPTGVSILTSKGPPPAKKSVVAKITSEVADGQATSGSKTVPAASWVHTCARKVHRPWSKLLAAVLDCLNEFFPATMQLMRLVAWAFDEIRSDRMKRRTWKRLFVDEIRGSCFVAASVKRGRTLSTGPDHGIS